MTILYVHPVTPPLDSQGFGSACGYPYPSSGITLRDHFAVEALNGILAATAVGHVFDTIAIQAERRSKVVAAYAYADLMLEVRDE